MVFIGAKLIKKLHLLKKQYFFIKDNYKQSISLLISNLFLYVSDFFISLQKKSKNNQLIIVKILFLQTNKSMKIVKTSKILKMLAKDGWVLVHQVGSHRQFRHPTKKGKVTVNGKPSDDTWGDELKSIEKQSGLTF